MQKQVSIAVIGRGKLGSSFAQKISKMGAGYKLFAHLPARSKSFHRLSESEGPSVIIVASRDAEIQKVAKMAVMSAGKNLSLMIHCSGSNQSTILPIRKGVTRLTLHPIQTFAKADPSLLKNIYFMASTDEASARKWAAKFVKDIGGIDTIFIKGKDLALYHTLVVFAANFTTLIGGAVEIFSKSLHIPPEQIKKAITPLMQQSLDNVLKESAKKVLTGPLARKDYTTILKHRLALQKQPKSLRKIYEGFVMLSEKLP